MRGKSFLVIALAASLGLSAAPAVAGPDISAQAMPGVNFSSFKTYGWAQAQQPSGGNPIIAQQIIADIDAALASKGYTKTTGDADLGLVLTMGAQDKTDVQSWGRFGLQTSVWQYTEGQLSLDAYDLKTKQAVWHGQASQTIDPKKPNQSKIDAAVTKLMAQFPGTAAASQ
jgi:hypothetical protein